MSRKSGNVIFNPIAIDCNTNMLGFFVLFIMILFTVDCFKPGRVASLLIERFLSSHSVRILYDNISEKDMRTPPFKYILLPNYS